MDEEDGEAELSHKVGRRGEASDHVGGELRAAVCSGGCRRESREGEEVQRGRGVGEGVEGVSQTLRVGSRRRGSRQGGAGVDAHASTTQLLLLAGGGRRLCPCWTGLLQCWASRL